MTSAGILQWIAMSLDELVLALQHRLDRLVRRLRLGPAPAPGGRRFVIVQIDGLSRGVLRRALAEGRMPFLSRLLRRHGYRLEPMAVGLPTSTPAFMLAMMYGVHPDIPGFHYHDKRRRCDVYFPRAGDAAWVEAAQAAGRRGILEGGSAYGCVFTGGAANNLFSFARLKRPTGRGVVRALSAGLVLAWVFAKSTVLTVLEVVRALLRFVADPVGESRRGWKWRVIKIGISVWVRQLFTLAVSRDMYAGVPAIYVNYLDYDVMAHAYGPRHRRALRALRRVDRAIRDLWRVARRVPEHRYDLYILSDHGQVACTPYVRLAGRGLERVLIDEFFAPAGVEPVDTARPHGRRLVRGIKALRGRREPGLFQRFVNYLAHDFLRMMGELPEAWERAGVRVIGAGPNAFVYVLASPSPVGIEAFDAQWPGLVDEISRARGVGFVLARSAAGPVCIVQGKRYRLDGADGHPFARRRDGAYVVEQIRALMAMPSAGDLVIYGHDAPEGHVSYVDEVGAHAGPAEEELYTFVLCPAGVSLPAPLTHPTQLYPHFLGYRAA
ncbi:MAG TPA: alkaline phosphatase family protein [Candidatus Binatia bacterium]|nr:alkaline phosphatase family protein [Candidatus Binatia bacterium]